MRTVAMLLGTLIVSMPFAGFGAEPSGLADLSHVAQGNARVKLGSEVLLEKQLDLIRGKRVGFITNPTGVDSALRSTIWNLYNCKDTKLSALFGPEHGVWGQYFAGEQVVTGIDPLTKLPAYSLYGKTQKPKAEWLKDLDVLVYEIQDIGSRGYTYIYTMALGMQAAKERGIPFIVLDRPDPLGGEMVDGNIVDYPRFSSFVGMYPIGYVYGMTAGETAKFFNEECGIGCDLKVVKMEGWRRNMRWWNTGLQWVSPSPGVPRPETTFYMGITGTLGEMQTVCEGVGTNLPFELLGAPWMDAFKTAEALNGLHLPGLYFRPTFFIPRYYVFKDKPCNGVQIYITDYDKVRPVTASIYILAALAKMYPEQNIFGKEKDNPKEVKARISMFDKVMGTDQVRLDLMKGKSAEEIIKSWEPQVKIFMEKRATHLLYE